MSPHDTLHERLADAAGSGHPTTRQGAAVRAAALRHRAQRRLLAGSGVVVAVAVVALATGTVLSPRTTSLGPATPPPATTTTAPAPSSSGPAPSSEPAGPPPLTREEAQQAVAELRFPAEAGWVTSPESRVHEDDGRIWLALRCADLPIAGDPLAVRFVSFDEVDFDEQRQVVVFEDGAQAATAFADLRSQMSACHAEPTTQTVGEEVWTTTVVGSQLELGDESFWVAQDMRITETDDPQRLGQEQIYTSADLLVLDDNVVVSIVSPAWKDEGRTTFVREASSEWAQFRPAYEDLRRR